MQKRKIFIWLDDVNKIHVSLAYQTEEELQKNFDWEDGERLLLELPFELEGAEGLGGEAAENYYYAFEGLLALSGMEAMLEILMAKMVKTGVSLAKHLRADKQTIH